MSLGPTTGRHSKGHRRGGAPPAKEMKVANRTEERRDRESEGKGPDHKAKNNDGKHLTRRHVFATGFNNDRVQTTRPRLMLNTMPPHVSRGPSLRQVAPPPHMCDCLRRVKTVRFLNG